jgi:hypothetical protein
MAVTEAESSVTWTDVLGAVGTAGTLIVAVLAAWIGLRQVHEARDLRIEQAQPYVFVDLQPNPASPTLTDFVVKNVGATAAFKIRLLVDPPPTSTLYPHAAQPRELAEYPLFAEGMPYLPPGVEFRFLFEDLPSLAARRDEFPDRYNVTVTYLDSHGRECDPGRYVLDLTARWNLLRVGTKTINDIGKSLDEMQKDLRRLRQVAQAIAQDENG